MSKLDVVALADLSEVERSEKMGAMFQQLGSLPEEEQLAALRSMIREMAEKATDIQYLRLCATNLTLAASLPNDQLKPFLANRMKASSSLPVQLAERDMKHVQEAISKAQPSIREKITSNM